MTNIKFNFDNVTFEDFFTAFEKPLNIMRMLSFLDRTVEGGIKHRPFSELPAIMARFTKVVTEQADDVGIAVGSMKRHLDE